MLRARQWCMAFVLCVSSSGAGQYWAPSELPVVVDGQLSQFYSNEEDDIFCICGRTRVPEGEPSSWRNGLVCNINGVWDTLGIFDHELSSVAKWSDTLFVSGGFSGVDWQAFPGNLLTLFDGTWHQDPQLTQPSHGGYLRTVGDSLFILGHYEVEPGIDTIGVGIRQDGRWQPLGNLPPPDSPNGAPWIFDIELYNGQLVIAGNINTINGYDVFVLEGNDWVPLGGGLVGWNSYGKRLAVYQGDLYLAGGIFMSQGDAGQNIMRWDGQQWHPLGTGLQNQLGNFGQFGAVEDMMVHDGELWVSGGFRYAGGVYARGVARWDGSQWCSVGGEPSATVFCFGFFQDTLYINNPGLIDGQDMNYVAKFVAPAYEDNCGLWAGLPEGTIPAMPLQVWPNPAGARIFLTSPSIGQVHVRIMDGSGRLVHERSDMAVDHEIELNISSLDPGLYHLEIDEQNGARRTARFVKE